MNIIKSFPTPSVHRDPRVNNIIPINSDTRLSRTSYYYNGELITTTSNNSNVHSEQIIKKDKNKQVVSDNGTKNLPFKDFTISVLLKNNSTNKLLNNTTIF